MVSLQDKNLIYDNNEAPKLGYELLIQLETKFRVDESDYYEVVSVYNGAYPTQPSKHITVARYSAMTIKEKQQILHDIRLKELMNPNYLVIRDPLTIEFNVTRFPYSASMCEAEIKIFNLNPASRHKIQKLRQLSLPFRVVEFRAGPVARIAAVSSEAAAKPTEEGLLGFVKESSSTRLPLIAKGYLFRAFSENDSTDVVTTIIFQGNLELVANAIYARGQIAKDVCGNADLLKTYNDRFGSNEYLPKIKYGDVAREKLGRIRLPDRYTPPSKNKYNIDTDFIDLAPAKVSIGIDNLDAFVYHDDDFAPGGYDKVISIDTGLLSTPIIEENMIKLKMMFEPRIIMLQAIKLSSIIYRGLFDNKKFKVVGIAHMGMLSGAVSAHCTTELTLQMGEDLYDTISGLDLTKFIEWDAAVLRRSGN